MDSNLELAARSERLALTGARDDVVLDLFLLHAQLDFALSVRLLAVLARVVVDFVVGVRADIDNAVGLDHQVRIGRFEIVVGLRPLAAAVFVAVLPIGDVIRQCRGPLRRGIVDFVFGTVLVGTRGVGHDERVLAIFVPEIVEDALLFHQPRNEIEVRFTVLHTVVPSLVLSFDLCSLKIAETILREDLLDDLDDRLVLKDAAVACLC